MPRLTRTTEVVRWSVNEDVYGWFLTLSNRLHVTTSTLVRMFLAQVKEGDPVTLGLVYDFVELGLLDAIVRPKVAKIFVDPPLALWLKDFVGALSHPEYPKRRIHSRHLLTGYVRYLQRHEDACIRYGAIRLQGAQPKEAFHAPNTSP